MVKNGQILLNIVKKRPHTAAIKKRKRGGKGGIYLNFLPFIVDVLQPGEEKTTVISRPHIFLVGHIVLRPFEAAEASPSSLWTSLVGIVNVLVTQYRANAVGHCLIGQSSSSSPMNSENFLREKKDKQIKNRAKNSLKRWDAFNKGPSMYYVII